MHELDLKFLVKVGAITGLAYGTINLNQEWCPKSWLNIEGNLAWVTFHTVFVLRCILGKECDKSHHGDTRIPPAGGGKPLSRITWRRARERPPPAESPEMRICAGSMAWWSESGGGRMRNRSAGALKERVCKLSSHSHAANASCNPHGKGYWGARR